MATCTCGNSCNCSCNRTLTPAGCGCSTPQCGCGTPTPYYNQAGACQEDHASTIVNEQFVTGIVTSSAATVPLCNQTTVLTIPGLTKINAGSYLWNPSIGYLQVVSFDYVSQQIVVRLDCTVDGAATPGTAIPACTLFNVTVPPADVSTAAAGDDTLYPFLQEDFTIPAAGLCGPAIVTNVNGLSAGKPVQLGSYTLTLSAVVNATTVTLCNDTGMVPFSTIAAHNGSGQHIVPVILVDASPCTNDEVLAGELIVCNGGIEQPLAGVTNGQVPVLVDSANNTVEFQLIDVPTLDCTTLAACITLTPAGTTYVITVVDASAFTVGDIVQFTNYPYRFEITNIAGNDITIVIDTSYHAAPAANVNLAIGQGFCLANCCEQLAASISALTDIVENPCSNAAATAGILDVAGQRVSIGCKQYRSGDPNIIYLPILPYATLDELAVPALYADGGVQTDWLELEVVNDSTCRVANGVLEFYMQAVLQPISTAGDTIFGYMVPQIGYETFTTGTGGTRKWTHAGGDVYTQNIDCWIPSQFIVRRDADQLATDTLRITLNYTGFFANVYADPGETIRIALRPQVQINIPNSPSANRQINILSMLVQAKLTRLHEPNALA